MPAASSRSSSIARRASSAAAAERVGRARRVAARLLDPHQHAHQPLLRAVVQVAADAAALGVGGGDDPRTRARDLLGREPVADVAEDDHGAAPVRPSAPTRS